MSTTFELEMKKLHDFMDKQIKKISRCQYTPGEWVKDRYPRREYTTSCNFRFVNLFEEVYDGREYVSKPPKGHCMKCKHRIVIKEN